MRTSAFSGFPCDDDASTDAAEKRYEAYRGKVLAIHLAVLIFTQAYEHLLAGAAHGRDQHTTGLELVEQLVRDTVAGGGEDDAAEGRIGFPTQLAVVVARAEVLDAELAETAARLAQQFLDALHGIDGGHD